MTTFTIFAEEIKTGRKARFLYDNLTSALCDAQGVAVPIPATLPIKLMDFSHTPPAPATSRESPLGKVRSIRKLKIQLGLNCNYDCSYCNQRSSLAAEGKTVTGPADVETFIEGLPHWFDGGEGGVGAGVQIEFWGGEPFVYWKTLKPLAEALRGRYSQANFLVITNGSLLDDEKIEWLDRLGFFVGISHDGPGQHARGPDPLDDEVAFTHIRKLMERLAPNGRISINSMIHRNNPSRAALNAWMVERFGAEVVIGEGSFIDPYDAGGLAQSVPGQIWGYEFSKQAFLEIRGGKARNLRITHDKVTEFIESIANRRPASVLGQKCGMDRQDTLAVDLKGNVLTCQNTSAAAIAPNGESHAIGHVSAMEAVQLKTATHWSHRPECGNCPVLQLCKGSCMFLEGALWARSCDNAFADNIAFFAAGFEALTGYVPVYIEGPQREDRKDIFGLIAGLQQPPPSAPRKIIPIKTA
jgi:uncharacterized protein